ncbi:DUF2235 domain-containing protein [Escherichia coli]|nr:DUF2235 domain-containing protein [Escherichia coli]
MGTLDIGAATRAQQADECKVGNCGRVWHVGFFFDGVGRNIVQDAPDNRLSNIVRLFRAYPDEEVNTDFVCHNKFYFSGMGTPYEEKTTEQIYTIIDTSMESMVDGIKDIPKDAAKDTIEDILGQSGSWYETLKNALKKRISPEDIRKKKRESVIDALKKTTIEAIQWIRDNEFVSAHFLTGDTTRINAAKLLFNSAFAENSKKKEGSPPPKIKSISISLYGYDTGATLARKFLDEFLKEVCQKSGEDNYLFKKVPVNIVFAGFFDCSRHSPASNNNGLDYFFSIAGKASGDKRVEKIGEIVSVAFGEKGIELDTALPGTVKQALHLAAAYERRLWRGLYRLGSTKVEHKEIMLPGCSEDVGGGLKPDEQKPSAELCRVALHTMYNAAFRAGVPFPDFNTLYEQKPVIANYFLINDTVEGRSVRKWMTLYKKEVNKYWQDNLVDVYTKVYGTDKVSDAAFDFYLDIYFIWLAKQYYLYCTELNQLDKELSLARREQISGYGPLTGMGVNPNTKADDINAQITELKALWGWLDDVRRVATGLSNDFNHGRPMDTRMQNHKDIYYTAWVRAELFLDFYHKAWNGEKIPEISWPGIETIHAYFSHDLQTVDAGASISESFFIRRMAESPKPEEKPDKNKILEYLNIIPFRFT